MSLSAIEPEARPAHFICVQFSDGAPIGGSELGPLHLAEAGLFGRDKVSFAELHSADDEEWPRARNRESVGRMVRDVLVRTYGAMARGEFPVVVGGDHSVSIGSVAGVAEHCRLARKPLFVLWLDAHGDFNTPYTSPSGCIHGMALAELCGKTELFLRGMARLDPRHVMLFGVRELDEGEDEAIAYSGAELETVLGARDVGFNRPIQAFLSRVRQTGGHLHVSLDADFLDPSVAPGVSTPVSNGATMSEAMGVMALLRSTGLVASLDVVEYNPQTDKGGLTQAALVKLYRELRG